MARTTIRAADAAVKKAAEAGMRIYTIGIGTPEGEIVSIPDGQGKSDYVRDEQGNVVKSHLNEALLRQNLDRHRGLLFAHARRKDDRHSLPALQWLGEPAEIRRLRRNS
jgi:hypothetical protein